MFKIWQIIFFEKITSEQLQIANKNVAKTISEKLENKIITVKSSKCQKLGTYQMIKKISMKIYWWANCHRSVSVQGKNYTAIHRWVNYNRM
jgi:hypothetical protein